MEKVAILLVVGSMVLAMSMIHGNGEGLKESDLEEWFQKLGQAKQKVTKLHFYFHDTVSGKNPTAIPLTKAKNLTTGFGVVAVIDDPLTLGPEPTSKVIGRAQGIDAAVNQEELGLTLLMNLVFTYGKYNGSTLVVSGSNPILQKHRELSILGGSGYFRLARGTVRLTTYFFDLKSGDAIVEYNLMVSHY